MYYIRQQTRVSGPFSAEQVRALMHRGRVARSDKISTDRVTWQPISECRDVVDHPGTVAAANATNAGPADVTVVDEGYAWSYTIEGQQQASTLGTSELRELIAAGRIGADDVVWRDGFDDWRAVSAVEELAFALPAPRGPILDVSRPVADLRVPAAPSRGAAGVLPQNDYQAFVAKKVPAGVVALLMGTLGIHKFMLGLTTGGIVMLVLCVLIVPIPVLSIVALVEGITYLTKSDAKFYEDYAVRKKQWF